MTLVNPKHMSATDIIEKCDPRDVVELVDRLVGNFLDREKLLVRVNKLRANSGNPSSPVTSDSKNHGPDWS